jgi:hypothetical protein
MDGRKLLHLLAFHEHARKKAHSEWGSGGWPSLSSLLRWHWAADYRNHDAVATVPRPPAGVRGHAQDPFEYGVLPTSSVPQSWPG